LHDSSGPSTGAPGTAPGESGVGHPATPGAALTRDSAPSEPIRRGPGQGTFSSLHFRDFRFLWIGTIFMSAGQWVQQVTLGWLLYDLTGSPVLLGALNGLRALPFLIAGPLAGVAADRMDRHKLLMGIQLFLMSAALFMGTLVASGQLEVWHLFVFSTITATAWSVNQPVRQTLVPGVVPRAHLVNAVALNSLGFNMTKVLGPALGGVLIASFGPAGNFFVQAAAYGCVLISVSFIATSFAPTDTVGHASVFANLREGLHYVWSRPVVRALMIAGLVPNILAMYQTMMPVFQKDILKQGPEALGLMMAAPGVGAVMSALFLASISRYRRKGLLLLFALALLGVFLIAFSQMESLPLSLLMLVGVGGAHIFYAAMTNTILQMIVPDELRGRVLSIYMLDHGLSPLGALLAGASTQLIGAPITMALMGLGILLLAVAVAVVMPELRRLEA
jgi:MFS family permease